MINTSLNFDGFNDLIQQPLESNDPESFAVVTAILTGANQPVRDAFNVIIHTLSGKSYKGLEARSLWRNMLGHKQLLEAKLGRRVGIRIAVLDYCELQKFPSTGSSTTAQKKTGGSLNLPGDMDDSLMQLFTAGYHLKVLKKELLRAKRYKHALSAMMVDIDNFHTYNEKYSYKDGDNLLLFVAKIIQKAIRSVDVAANCSGDRFLIVLPNTNQREAMELADRLKTVIQERTARIPQLSSGMTVTMVTGQASDTTNSLDFLHTLENKLNDGKNTQRNVVYTL
jgi:diguanylate cyclase (GGDEF)-like protein